MESRASQRGMLEVCWGLAVVVVALAAVMLTVFGFADLPASAAWILFVSCVVFAAAFFGSGAERRRMS